MDKIKVGTILLVWMKRGDWWTEIKRGVPLIVTEVGENKVRVKEQYDIMRKEGWEMTVSPHKDPSKLNLSANDKYGRSLVVTIKEGN